MLPFVCEGIHRVHEGGVEVRFGRVPGSVEPGVPIELRGQLPRDVGVRAEEVEDRRLEVVAIEALASPLCKVVWHKGVEFLLADQPLDVIQEMETLLVRDAREGIIGILALEVEDQFREVVVLSILLDRVAQRLPPDDGREVAPRVAVHGGLDPALQVRRPALVEPEVFPARGGDKIAAPRVAQLVRDDVDVLAVAGDDGGSRERVDGVLHAAVGEAGGQDEEVVRAPGVGVDERLGGLQEALRVGFEFPFAGGEFVWARGDAAAGSDGGVDDVSACEGEEVGGDGDGLVERVEVACAGRAVGIGVGWKPACDHG